MAKKLAAWGIDVGQYGLKALRCRAADDGTERINAEAFDFIEYPKPLSSPDADPVALVKDALKAFLGRNKVKGDKVVISVPGQAGLARFIKLPPVETKKIPDIVKYEAKQQIPFPLNEVVWDYQQMGAGAVEEGFALECEVGIFAMKRDQVEKALKPFVDAKIEVDIVQLTPLALFNWVVFDQLRDLPTPEMYDADNPPESTVVLSIGTETSDFVVTNGFKMWQRSLPVGGNHFTKALVKEMKMNYATAEHLKRNAQKAEDPKALFQAMRPVFSDLLSEVEKSMKFFSNLDRTAKVSKIIALGNAVKLPGLQRFLTQNLGFDVTKPEAYRNLSGPGIIDAPAFKENLLSYGVSYGLALQGLGKAKIGTNLLPHEIRDFRIMRAKKPWAIAAAALLLAGFGVNYWRHFEAANSVRQTNYFGPAVTQAQLLNDDARKWQENYDTAKTEFKKTYQIGDTFLQNVQGRILWLELLRSVNACLPREAPAEFVKKFDQAHPNDKRDIATILTLRPDLKITNFECIRVERLEDWFAGRQKEYREGIEAIPKGLLPPGVELPAAVVKDENGNEVPPPADESGKPIAAGPTGPGWVFQFKAYHHFNHQADAEDRRLYQGLNYLRYNLLVNLLKPRIEVPKDPPELGQVLAQAAQEKWAGAPEDPKFLPVGDLGIRYPVLIGQQLDWDKMVDIDPEQGLPGVAPGAKQIKVPRYDVIVEFCWQEVLPSERGKKPADGVAQK